MRVFLSWSGDKSRAVAEALRDWLPNVIQDLDPFLSAKDITPGARWGSVLADELREDVFGIICVTEENQASPWLNFEAGALAKAVGEALVIPLAVDLKLIDLRPPLSQFQGKQANEDGVREILEALNGQRERPLTTEQLGSAFDKWWGDLKEALTRIEAEHQSKPAQRSDRELLEETLSTVRALHARQPAVPTETAAAEPAVPTETAPGGVGVRHPGAVNQLVAAAIQSLARQKGPQERAEWVGRLLPDDASVDVSVQVGKGARYTVTTTRPLVPSQRDAVAKLLGSENEVHFAVRSSRDDREPEV